MRHEVATRVDATADVVWQTISVVEKWPEWTPTMESVRWQDKGELAVGSTAEVRQPKQPVRRWTVTELTPGRAFTWITNGGPGVRFTADHEVTTDADGQVVATLAFTVSGLLAPVVALLGGRTIRRMVDTEARSLKSWCERS